MERDLNCIGFGWCSKSLMLSAPQMPLAHLRRVVCMESGTQENGGEGEQHPLPSKSGDKGGKSAHLMLSTDNFFTSSCYIRSSLRLDFPFPSGIEDLP